MIITAINNAKINNLPKRPNMLGGWTTMGTGVGWLDSCLDGLTGAAGCIGLGSEVSMKGSLGGRVDFEGVR